MSPGLRPREVQESVLLSPGNLEQADSEAVRAVRVNLAFDGSLLPCPPSEPSLWCL